MKWYLVILFWDTETEKVPIHCFTSHMITVTGNGLSRMQILTTQSRSLIWETGTKLLKPSLLPPRIYNIRKLESYASSSILMWDVDILTSTLTTSPNILLPIVVLICIFLVIGTSEHLFNFMEKCLSKCFAHTLIRWFSFAGKLNEFLRFFRY